MYKKRDARAKLFFFSQLNILLFDASVAVAVVVS